MPRERREFPRHRCVADCWLALAAMPPTAAATAAAARDSIRERSPRPAHRLRQTLSEKTISKLLYQTSLT